MGLLLTVNKGRAKAANSQDEPKVTNRSAAHVIISNNFLKAFKAIGFT